MRLARMTGLLVLLAAVALTAFMAPPAVPQEPQEPAYTLEHYSYTVASHPDVNPWVAVLSPTGSGELLILNMGALPGFYLNVAGEYYYLGESRSFQVERIKFSHLLRTVEINKDQYFLTLFKSPRIAGLEVPPLLIDELNP